MLDLGSLTVPTLGAAGLLTVAVFLVLRGWLVPRIVVTEMRKNDQERIDDLTKQRDQWIEAYMAAEAGRRTADRQVEALLEGARTTASVVAALPKAGDE